MSNVPSSQSLLEAIFHLAADPMDTSNSDHLAALRKIAALADNAMRGRVDEDVHHDGVPLSNGELTLLELLVQSASNKVIARKLDIAEGTVKIRLLFSDAQAAGQQPHPGRDLGGTAR
jgi:ATP/maltotriose-dependent transcriptional regulator MalT